MKGKDKRKGKRDEVSLEGYIDFHDKLGSMMRGIDRKAALEWAKRFAEDFYLEDPFQSTFVIWCMDNDAKSCKIQKLVDMQAIDMFMFGRELTLKGLYPYAYCIISEGMMEGGEEEGWCNIKSFDPSEAWKFPEVLSCVFLRLDREASVISVAEVEREQSGDKHSLGEWEDFDEIHVRELSVTSFWLGAASGAIKNLEIRKDS
jgi:hypothetical protein